MYPTETLNHRVAWTAIGRCLSLTQIDALVPAGAKEGDVIDIALVSLPCFTSRERVGVLMSAA